MKSFVLRGGREAALFTKVALVARLEECLLRHHFDVKGSSTMALSAFCLGLHFLKLAARRPSKTFVCTE